MTRVMKLNKGKISLELNERIVMAFILLSLPLFLYSQGDKKFIRQGNREFDKDKFPESEISYRRAADKNQQSADALFNIGDALYKQNKFEDAGKQFLENHNMVDDKTRRSASLYNLGNSLLMANKVQESIEAYKGSLKLDPDNMEAKYNLAYAQDLLQQQENQEQDKDKQDQDQDQDQKNDQDQENKDQDQQQDNQEQKQEQEQKDSEQKEISKEDAERLLNALANDEKNVQEKVKLAKALKARVKTVKNW